MTDNANGCSGHEIDHKSPFAAGSSARGRTIAAIVPHLRNSSRMEALSAAQRRLSFAGYSVLIFPTVRAEDGTLAWCSQLSSRVNGVLIFDSCCNASLLGALTEQNLPVMLVNAEAPDTSSVAVDHTSGLSSVLRHLVDLGHHRIAFIDDPDGPLAGAYLDRGRSAYSAALRGVRLARRAYYERTADGGSQAASVVLDELLDLPERPTAVVVGSDRHALAIIDTMRRVGLRVPQDLCIVGYGDSAAAVYFGLTTIQLPLQAVGTQAAILLLRAVADAQVPPVTIRLTPELVVRGTCGVRSQAKGQPDGPSGRDVMVTAVACSTRPA